MAVLKTITMAEEEVRKLKHVGSGTYGAAFADEENKVLIKVYHSIIKGEYWCTSKNPCLNVNKIKFKRLNKRNKKIQFTNTAVELIYDGFKFIGVKTEYYEGPTLDDLNHCSLTLKKEILTQLIRNSKELTKHKIYNLDCKPNNIIITDNSEVQIIDLNDILTKVTLIPNIVYKKISQKRLQNTVMETIYSNQYFFSESVVEKLTSNPENNPDFKFIFSYNELQKFVDEVKFYENIIIIKMDYINNMDLETLRNYLRENELELVLAVNKSVLYSSDKLSQALSFLERADISIYDIFRYNNGNYDDYEAEVKNYITAHESKIVHTYEQSFKILQKK